MEVVVHDAFQTEQKFNGRQTSGLRWWNDRKDPEFATPRVHACYRLGRRYRDVFLASLSSLQAANAFLTRAEELEKEGKLDPAVDYLRSYLRFHPEMTTRSSDWPKRSTPRRENPETGKGKPSTSTWEPSGLKGVSQEKKAELCARAAELLLDVRDYVAARHGPSDCLASWKDRRKNGSTWTRTVLAVIVFGHWLCTRCIDVTNSKPARATSQYC